MKLLREIAMVCFYAFFLWLPMWALAHYSDKISAADIAAYSQALARGENPVYQVMGIPVNWTPYDE